MTPRIRNTRQAAEALGMTVRAFMALRDDKTFPKPVHARKHHLFWDMKAIENYFDKTSGLTAESDQEYYDKLAEERIHGDHPGEIPRH